MPRSARLQQLIESLSPTEEAELAEELARRERERGRLKAAREFLEEYEAEHGLITEEEIAQVRREWPRD